MLKTHVVTALLFVTMGGLALAPLMGWSGPLDGIRPLKIDAEALKRTAATTPIFELSGFKLTRGAEEGSARWSVDLKAMQVTPDRTHVLRSVVLDGRGEVLHAGDDIILPAYREGQVRTLTRPLSARSGITTLTLEVVDRRDGTVLISQRHPLSDITAVGLQGASTARGTASPSRTASPPPVPDGTMDYAISFQEQAGGAVVLTLQNRTNFALNIDELMARPDYSAGHSAFASITNGCDTTRIPPQGSATCRYSPSSKCSAVQGIEFKLKLNGNISFHEWMLNNVIKRISHDDVAITIKKETSWNTQYINGPGIAEVRVLGQYLKPGEQVTMKGIMSVDSHDFPVVFEGRQEDARLFGRVAVEGKRVEAPEKVCFRLMEITTDEQSCGGVGVLMYRNRFASGATQLDSKDFFRQIHCK